MTDGDDIDRTLIPDPVDGKWFAFTSLQATIKTGRGGIKGRGLSNTLLLPFCGLTHHHYPPVSWQYFALTYFPPATA